MKGSTSPARNGLTNRTRFHLSGRSIALDGRIHAARGDLADISLAGTLFSAHYARAVELTCIAAGTPVYGAPSTSSGAVSELLRGEVFHALDLTTDWAWGFCGHDGYVGYVRRDALDVRELATHRVATATAPLFATADIKSPITDYWPRGALLQGEAQGDFIVCAEGFVHARHVAPANQSERDWTAIAELYLGMPYVWGGRGHRGVDCSGLVQIALSQCGIAVPRDTDLQREGIGSPLAEGDSLIRGDIVFFPGHVGIMTDDAHLLHANAHWMAVVVEPLADVIARFGAEENPVLTRRRIG